MIDPAAAPAAKFSIRVERIEGFEFRVRFDKDHYATLLMDEPAPLGGDIAPNAARVLAAAIGNCLSASLVFCLGRSKIAVGAVEADVDVELVRNEQRRLRVGRVTVTLRPELLDPTQSAAECVEAFEDFCIVTQSVRQGIDVAVHVDLEGLPTRSDSGSPLVESAGVSAAPGHPSATPTTRTSLA